MASKQVSQSMDDNLILKVMCTIIYAFRRMFANSISLPGDDGYLSLLALTFLQKFGANLNEASQLGGIFHVRGNLWVAIAIDIAAQELLYGDPGASAPESAVIPCPSQNFQNDWFNSALFSYNALLHYFLPSQPLLQHTDNPVFGDLARISVLRDLVSLHIAASHLPDDLALPSEAFKGCECCLKLTAAQRSLAASASAGVSPGALVAASSASSVNHNLSKMATPSAIPTTLPALPRNDSSFFGPRSRKELHQSLDLAIVKLICVARLSPSLVDYPEWKEIYKLQTPRYVPASRTKLADSHIMSEQENVRQLQITELKNFQRLSVSFDGGSIMPTRKVMLLEGQECTDESHTGEWIANLVFRVIDLIGLDRFIAVSADNTGNTRVAREIVTSRFPNLLNLPDPTHHLNNAWKDIAALAYFASTVQRIQGVIKFFKHSNHAKSLLKDLRERLLLGPGLESISKTRFATLLWAAISLQRCLPAIRQLRVSGQINIPSYNNLFTQNMASLQFELRLTQFVAVGEGIARCIECLEATAKATATNPADIYLYWLAMLARMRQTLETCALPDDVCGQIRGIINSRWQEFFINGPTNVHLSAFYLNPTYLRSSIFKNPNPLSFSITLPARMPSKVPPGVRNPKTFEVFTFTQVFRMESMWRVESIWSPSIYFLAGGPAKVWSKSTWK
ncbi:hypothetical protein GALMADRAFT_142787 [Galerina marginata CBS 339.88]|uniref:DUF659 domain-containing protein n=1 Tax=Galerina marginata (strain CBS 339.88) TaxID=685588 RepID=A0A067SNH6_GALM3|nr:hypothetical protein GALMADRAFT_142787 [Galerina marginata CBS 339.88]